MERTDRPFCALFDKMRIIAGIARGRKLAAPGSRGVKNEIRPTSDRAREALFNILGDRVRGARVLDLFAGTGALGLEALSRGARSALFIDMGPAAIGLIRKNVILTDFSEKAAILRKDLTKKLTLDDCHIPSEGFSLVFLDPPYQKHFAGRFLDILEETFFLGDGCTVVAESSGDDQLPEKAGALLLYDKRQYGKTGFWFYLLQHKE